MRSIGCVGPSHHATGLDLSARVAPDAAARGCRAFMRTTGILLLAASLGACAQSSVVSQRAGHIAPAREAALEPRHELRPVHRPVSVVRLREPERSEPAKRVSIASSGG